jgi:hypothetical protein
MSDAVDTSTATDAAVDPSPEETDWKAEARKWEQRAKEANKRVKDLEPAAQRAQELEDAQKSTEQKAAERLAAAEARATELELKATRAEVAAEKGVPANLLAGASKEELEASADALIAFRGEQKQTPRSEALARANQTKVEGDEVAFLGELFAKD